MCRNCYGWTAKMQLLGVMNHSLSFIKTTLKEAKIFNKEQRKEDKQTTQHRMDQSPFLIFWGLETGCSFYWLSAPTPLQQANREMKRKEGRRGHFCIERLERLIRTSWVKHEKERERVREEKREKERKRDAERQSVLSVEFFKCVCISMGSSLCVFWSVHMYGEVL